MELNHHCPDFACLFASNFLTLSLYNSPSMHVGFFLFYCSTLLVIYPHHVGLFHQLIVQTRLFCAQMWCFTASDRAWQELSAVFIRRPGWTKTTSTYKVSCVPYCRSGANGRVLLVLGDVQQKALLTWKLNFRLKQLLKFLLGGSRAENWFGPVQNATVRNFQGSVYLLRKLYM